MELRDYQREAVYSIFRYFDKEKGKAGNPLILLPTGCHAKGTKILMHDGSVKLVEDIVPGDKLMGPDSTPRTVLNLCRGKQEMRLITPVKGEPFVVNKDHILHLKQMKTHASEEAKYIEQTVEDYQQSSDWHKHIHKLHRVSVDFNEAQQPLDPYFLGLMLGDGSLAQHTVTFTGSEQIVLNAIRQEAVKFGCATTEKICGNATHIRIVGPRATRSKPNVVMDHLRMLGLDGTNSYSVFVPQIYKVASREQRIKLLSGLIDADGYYSCNCYQICTVSKQLSEDIVFIARSLGLAAYSKKSKAALNSKFISWRYDVWISGEVNILKPKIGYKQPKPRQQKKDVLCTAFKVTNLKPDNFYGFTLDGDHLYLTADFVVHHNTGKSLVIAGFLDLLYKWYPNQRVMMLTHVKELIAQNYDKLMKVWPEAPAGIYSAGLKRKEVYNLITFAGIASVAKHPKKFGKVDLIFVDEAHLISPRDVTMYKKFFAALREVNPYLKIIGLTATPYRLGYGSIVKENEDDDALFDKVTFDATTPEAFNWFLEQGYLLPVVPKRTKMELDLNGVGKRGGEFIQSELQNAVNRDDATLRALEEAIECGEDRQSWLIFCSGIEHAKDACDMLNDMGISCGCIHSKLDAKERDEIIEKFKRGEFRALTNNNVLTTGFDHPMLDLIIMLRPTASAVLWVQMLGRGTRPVYAEGFDLSTQEGRLQAIAASPKQNCLVLDFSGNTRRLGPINDPVKPKRPGEKGAGTAPVKECDVCGSYNHASARYCGGFAPIPMDTVTQEQVQQLYLKGFRLRGTDYVKEGFCGHEFKFQTKLKKAASTEALIKQDIPVVEDFKVTHVTYAKHTKRNDSSKPPTMKVTYYCGSKIFSEWVALLHGDWAGRKAVAWWKKRTHLPLPQTIEEALDVAAMLKTPKYIKVHTNKKWPEILNYDYDGTCFGKFEAPQDDEAIQVKVYGQDGTTEGPSYNDDVSWDDIVSQNTQGITVNNVVNPVQVDDPDYVPF